MATGLAKLSIAAPVLAVFSVVGAVSSPAQVTLDGSANPSFKGPAPFEAGNYDLRAELGRRAGPNLFHSFGKFSLRTGERATFSGPDGIERIISRVTGGARSDIDGTIASTIPGADFYFLNPAGVVFGPNASLDLQGSFHVSTADELRFADGAAFSATDPAASSFTVAAPKPSAFWAPSQRRLRSGAVPWPCSRPRPYRWSAVRSKCGAGCRRASSPLPPVRSTWSQLPSRARSRSATAGCARRPRRNSARS